MDSLPILLHWSSGSLTDTGRVRAENQDACLDRPDLGLWAVADGMGGHQGGGYASTCLIDALDAFDPCSRLDEAILAIEEATLSVNQRLIIGAREMHASVIGTTLVAVVALGEQCAILWVGDSRVYRWREDELQLLTRDHSQVQWMVDAGLLTLEEAERHPLSNILTRAVGGDPALAVEQRIEMLCAGDRYLLCSDGLVKELHGETIAKIVAREDSAGEICHALVEAACEAGGRDNVTAVVIDFEQSL